MGLQLPPRPRPPPQQQRRRCRPVGAQPPALSAQHLTAPAHLRPQAAPRCPKYRWREEL